MTTKKRTHMRKYSHLHSVLTDIGLTDKEASVYRAALQLGATTAQQIAHDTNLKRTTAYSVIESLMQKGLMRIEMVGFKKRYVAENPDKLRDILHARQRAFDDVLPEFLAMHNLKEKESTVKLYQGIEAVKNAYEHVLTSLAPHDSYCVLSSQKQFEELDPFFVAFQERRAKIVHAQVIATASTEARKAQKLDMQRNRETLLLPEDTQLTINTIMTPHQVMFHQLVPPVFAIVIDNKSVVEAQQQMFRITWNALHG